MTAEVVILANSLPEKPGVYIFKNTGGEIIYVGKAKRLKRRVQSYFRESNWKKNEKVKKIASDAVSLDFIVVTTEKEALILEANLIFKHKPRYNVLLKDSRHYPYIYISDDEFPYVSTMRTREKAGSYYGPYTSFGLVRRLLELLQRIYKVRNCTYDLSKKRRPCFAYHLKMCSAPCAGKANPEEYAEQVRSLKEFLDGDTQKVRMALEGRMLSLADALQFEKASEIRDVISSMDKLYAIQGVDVSEDVSGDILALSSGLAVLLKVRGGMLLGKLIFDFSEGSPMEFVTQFYYGGGHRFPDFLIVEGLKKSELRQLKGETSYIGEPRDEQEQRLLEIANENIAEELKVRLSSLQSLKQAKELLGLKKLPNRIEGMDISHTQGLYTVASLVVFVNGRPQKSDYRRYRIQEIDQPNDFESLATVVKRRYSKHEIPDLLFIDGGEPQLRAVKNALSSLEIDNLDFIGIAKENEEIVFPDARGKIKLDSTHPVQRLITAVRDESHRFAVSYHRTLRDKRMTSSNIDNISGIGPKRKRELLKAFGGIGGIKKATEKELADVLKNRGAVESVLKWIKENGG